MPDQKPDPRTDPVGTVRQDATGRVAVKITMGNDTGKGQHVWVVTDENLERRWFHHVEVARWRVLPSPPPSPRVFFRGDTVPGNVCVVDEFGTFYSDDRAWEVTVVAPVVALTSPTPEEWQAAVDAATAAVTAAWQHTESVEP